MFTERSKQGNRFPEGSFRGIFRIGILLFTVYCLPFTVAAASLALEPAAGTFVVGSTFNVSIVLDSDGGPVNAIHVELKFPPDKLQLVSPSTGQSIITLWTSQPSYNNQTGTLSLQGVIPNGITTSRGLVTTLVFRAKNPGDAYVKFLDTTKVLKHDGLGTDVLSRQNGAVYRLMMPPPNGPIVASQTHPDPSQTYRTNTVLLAWTPEDADVDQFSYLLSREPVDIPDDTPETTKNSVVYKDVEDGTNFFHIKGLRHGSWGGTTHFAINIDVTPPAEFPVEILPGARTVRRQPILQFATTDAYSGIDHYELKVVPLFGVDRASGGQRLFIEATSPYVLPELALGKHDIIVRAYDKAGNYRETTARLEIVPAVLRIAGADGIEFSQRLLVPWWSILLLLVLLVLVLVLVAVEVHKRHTRAHARLSSGALPIRTAADIMAIKAKRDEYRPFTPVPEPSIESSPVSVASPPPSTNDIRPPALPEKEQTHLTVTQIGVLLALFMSGALLVPVQPARAEDLPVEPPLVTTLSRDIANDEIFYAGGVAGAPNATVILYVQNITTGAVMSEEIVANDRGQWFYRHGGFLSAGEYILWVQTKFGDVTSPPSPQERLTVARTALQLGASRISYELLYELATLALLILVAGLAVFIYRHDRLARRKHDRWMKEVREAEESVRRGFAVLKRDIEAELATIRKAKLTKELKAEEVGREQQLLKDLEWAEQYMTKEVWDIEREG